MSADRPIVYIVDDDAAVRRSLCRLIRAAGRDVEAFSSACEFVTQPPSPRPGCVVLDVHMPEMSGRELQAWLAERELALPVIFLTGHADVTTGVDAMKNGAVDFLLKPVEEHKLLDVIDAALCRCAAQHAAQIRRREGEARLHRLSRREREVMEYVNGGSLNKRIAAELDIAVKTVKAHRAQIMQKLELRSVADLVRLCESVGVTPRHA